MAKRTSHVLVDHDEIRRWADARDARPVSVRGTGGGRDIGMIRLDLPGYVGEEKLRPVTWDQWFDKFEDTNLALVVEETTARGQKSNFNKLISRESVDLETGRLVQAPRRRRKEAARAGAAAAGAARVRRATKRRAGARKAAAGGARKPAAKKASARKATARKATARKATVRAGARKGVKSTGRRTAAKTARRGTTAAGRAQKGARKTSTRSTQSRSTRSSSRSRQR